MSRHAKMNPARPIVTTRQLVEGQPDIVEITTPSIPGIEAAIAHSLGRMPKGYIIVKGPYSVFNHGESGRDWTPNYLYLKFSITDETVTIAIF